MVEEEEQKLKIFNTVHMNHLNDTPKKKYFRIEKNKPYSSKESHAKAIFRTKKDYNFLRRKTLREIETQKQNKNNNNKNINTNKENKKAKIIDSLSSGKELLSKPSNEDDDHNEDENPPKENYNFPKASKKIFN